MTLDEISVRFTADIAPFSAAAAQAAALLAASKSAALTAEASAETAAIRVVGFCRFFFGFFRLGFLVFLHAFKV